MKIEALLEKLAATCKSYVDRHVGELREQVKALPAPEPRVTDDELKAMIGPLIPAPAKGDPGEAPTVDQLKAIIEPLIPQPVNGEDGHTPNEAELKALIAPLIPAPVKGDAGPAPDVELLKSLIAPLIPAAIHGEKGVDGVNGKDGRTPTADEIKALIEPMIPVVEKAIDGKNGRDGVDGQDGRPGRDAAQIDIQPSIDEARSYPRGSYATHKGGLWRAFESTKELRGWECIVRGFDGADLIQIDDRTWTLKLMTSTDTIEKTIKVPSLLDRGVFKDSEAYEPGDCVTFGGSTWIAQKGFDQYGKPGAIGSGWRLSVRAGRDYRDQKR